MQIGTKVKMMMEWLEIFHCPNSPRTGVNWDNTGFFKKLKTKISQQTVAFDILK